MLLDPASLLLSLFSDGFNLLLALLSDPLTFFRVLLNSLFCSPGSPCV